MPFLFIFFHLHPKLKAMSLTIFFASLKQIVALDI